MLKANSGFRVRDSVKAGGISNENKRGAQTGRGPHQPREAAAPAHLSNVCPVLPLRAGRETPQANVPARPLLDAPEVVGHAVDREGRSRGARPSAPCTPPLNDAEIQAALPGACLLIVGALIALAVALYALGVTS